jgi:exonuclease VII small subunit
MWISSKEEQKEWNEINLKVSKILNRDVTYEPISKVFLEIVRKLEDQQHELEDWRDEFMGI